MEAAFSYKNGFDKYYDKAVILLNDLINILNEYKIEYFAISGTLLGFIRHCDFIPWDDDIDIMVNKTQLETHLPEIIEKYKNKLNFFLHGNYYYKVCNKDNYILEKLGKLKPLTDNNKYYWPFIDLFTYTGSNTEATSINFFHKKYEATEFFPLGNFYFHGFNVSIPKNPDYFLKLNYGKDYMTRFVSNHYCHKKESGIKKIYTMTTKMYETLPQENEEIKLSRNIKLFNYLNAKNRGTEIKLLQYTERNLNNDIKPINIIELINGFFPNGKTEAHLCLINLEKDSERYKSTVDEIKKLNVKNFTHIIGTYYKDKKLLTKDLNYILNYIEKGPISINELSEISDSNIYIQDGPLGCLCSHIRSLIFGYNNYKDYTIIIEDDIFINSTDIILENIKNIPEDWDIICLNAMPKDIYDEGLSYYKFTGEFHSTHFYIVRNKIIPFILQNIYPMIDQIDILISKLYNKINIYNIPHCIYQKSMATNTQNNLHAIYNSPNYVYIKNLLDDINLIIIKMCNIYLKDNIYNENIGNYIFQDIILYNITSCRNSNTINDNINTNTCANNIMKELHIKLSIVFATCIKVANLNDLINSLINMICEILLSFNLTANYGIPYFYGSSANVYMKNNNIMKVYNKKLRWTNEKHNDIDIILNKEINMLKTQRQKNLKLIDYSLELKQIEMSYAGISLYNKWILPANYKEQLLKIFNDFTDCNIIYSEFRLQNILVNENEEITICDFGLAEEATESKKNNDNNYKIFCQLLEILDMRFKNEPDTKKQNILYNTFINNMRDEYKDNIY